MSRTVNRTETVTLTADAYITRALKYSEDAYQARIAALVADRAGDPDKAHAATLAWADAAHFLRVASEKGRKALALEGRNPGELADVLAHAAECRTA